MFVVTAGAAVALFPGERDKGPKAFGQKEQRASWALGSERTRLLSVGYSLACVEGL